MDTVSGSSNNDNIYNITHLIYGMQSYITSPIVSISYISKLILSIESSNDENYKQKYNEWSLCMMYLYLIFLLYNSSCKSNDHFALMSKYLIFYNSITTCNSIIYYYLIKNPNDIDDIDDVCQMNRSDDSNLFNIFTDNYYNDLHILENLIGKIYFLICVQYDNKNIINVIPSWQYKNTKNTYILNKLLTFDKYHIILCYDDSNIYVKFDSSNICRLLYNPHQLLDECDIDTKLYFMSSVKKITNILIHYLTSSIIINPTIIFFHNVIKSLHYIKNKCRFNKH